GRAAGGLGIGLGRWGRGGARLPFTKRRPIAATTKMFVRFRQYTDRLLQISIIETRRIDGKVRHELVARLGSVAVPPSVPDRLAVWQRLPQRLPKLSTRLSPAPP